MKNMLYKMISILLVVIASPSIFFSQELYNDEFEYEVYRVYPPISNSKSKLSESHTLSDLNKYFESSWIKEFISVELFTIHNGVVIKAESKDYKLTLEQKTNIQKSDVATNISVLVKYIPDNTFSDNEIKEINFTVTVTPEIEASFPDGKEKLNKYVKENVIDKIPDSSYKEHHLMAANFTIDREGHIVNVYVSHSSEDKKIDNLMVEAICNMPIWKPAAYANGQKAEQDFVLAVGDMKSCVINLLNIHQ